MNDAATMCIFERFADLAHDAERSLLVDLPAVRRIQDVGKGPAIQPLQDDVVKVIVAIKIDKPNDVRMREATALGRFLLQSSERLPVPRQLRRQDLDSYPRLL